MIAKVLLALLAASGAMLVGWVTIVTNIQGRSVAETAPTNGQALVYDTSTGTWKPGDVAASLTAHQSTHQPGQDDSLADTFVVTTRSVTAAGSYVTGGGDLSANRTFSLALGAVSADVTPTWTNIQSKPSTFAPSAHAASHTNGTDNLTVSGFLTVDATAGISPRYSTADFDVSGGNLVLATVATASTVGDASSYPVITFDAKGRILSASTMPVSATSAASTPVEQHELIPLYIYPGASWDTVKSEYPGVGIIIANPASGPGTSVEANYKSYIFKMQQHGLKVIGYVPTNYEATDIATVKANIDKWYSFYWPDGIFLDQISASPNATQLAYLQELYTYIKAKSEIAVVVLNPGTNCLESLMTCADILATYENDYSDYAAYTPDTWAAKYHPTRFWHLIYNATEAEAVTARALARSRNVGWTFVTDDTMVDWNPFDTLATYGVTQTAYMKDELARRTPDDPMSSVCGGRVTKQDGKFVFAPYTSNRCCLFVDGVWRPYVIPDAGLSIDCSPSALGADVDGWIYADGSSGTLAIKESKTGVTLQNGIAVQSGDVGCLALVRFRTNNYGAVIAVDDAPSKAMFCNYFNRRPNVVSKAGSTEHVYGTGSWAYWNANSAEKVEWVGVDAAPVTCLIDGALTPTAGSPRLGVGLNAATAHAYAYQGTTSPLVVGAHYSGAQSAGANYAAALEYATNNTTYSSYRLTVQVMQ